MAERVGRGRMCCGTGQSSGKVENIKGNVVGTDFNHFLLQYCIFAYPILIKSAAELRECSLKYEPSLLTKQASLGWDNNYIAIISEQRVSHIP